MGTASIIGKKSVSRSSCAKIDFNILIYAQIDQATFIVNLTKM